VLKKFNILYIIVPLLCWVAFDLSKGFSKETISFYGFAENKETEINLEHPVEVNTIHVTPGQKVKKGALLLEGSYSQWGKKSQEAQFKIQELRLDYDTWKEGLKSSIDRLEAQKSLKSNDILAKIASLKAKQKQNAKLFEGLKSVDITESVDGPMQQEIESLQAELTYISEPIDVEIKKIKRRLNAKDHPSLVRIRQLESEAGYFEAKAKKLSIFAPSDGLIGNIHCKEAENVSSFNTLISFYEENPTLVEGFVHESMILEVKVGEKLEVISSLHPNRKCIGEVTGLGSRIVEIPTRLRKMEEIKNYGREVLIKIPSKNDFLQKEKVQLKLPEEAPKSFLESLFE